MPIMRRTNGCSCACLTINSIEGSGGSGMKTTSSDSCVGLDFMLMPLGDGADWIPVLFCFGFMPEARSFRTRVQSAYLLLTPLGDGFRSCC